MIDGFIYTHDWPGRVVFGNMKMEVGVMWMFRRDEGPICINDSN